MPVIRDHLAIELEAATLIRDSILKDTQTKGDEYNRLFYNTLNGKSISVTDLDSDEGFLLSPQSKEKTTFTKLLVMLSKLLFWTIDAKVRGGNGTSF